VTRERKPTATSSFGVGRREAHDATDFYARFTAPEISTDDQIADAIELADPFICGDASQMKELPDNSVALVVTSPPYFAGKQYELEVEREGIPASYGEYLEMLLGVFRECHRVLEPGGRIAVNVANLGRKPYRSLSADVIRLLESDLKMLLRGEVIWRKQQGTAGSCAWGSFRSPANPVLRDITERVIIAGKGRFDRAITTKARRASDRPHLSTLNNDEFMDATLDVWEIEPESARRVGHPAPFPLDLPKRLVHLYTYVDDLVLDPFMGSGTTLAAAATLGRRYVGYDLDPAYVEIARQRVAEVESGPRPMLAAVVEGEPLGPLPAPPVVESSEDFQARARIEGRAAQDIAEKVLAGAGFEVLGRNVALRGTGLTINFLVADQLGGEWYIDVSGAFTTTRAGLLRTDTVWKSLGRASVLKAAGKDRVLFLTSDLPKRNSAGDRALRTAGPDTFVDALRMLSDVDMPRLAQYAAGQREPLLGFWTAADLGGN
jgi:site-specific DNA-methyltransferase (adenine-specific)